MNKLKIWIATACDIVFFRRELKQQIIAQAHEINFLRDAEQSARARNWPN